MTVPTTAARVAYVGNGVTVAFAIPFKFLTNADIATYVNGALTPTGVTITGAGADAGTATFAVAPAVAAQVVLVRAQINDQQTDLPANGPFPAQSVETMGDKAMIGIQQVNDAVQLAIRAPTGDTSTLTALPLVATRAGKMLGFNVATGQPEVSTFTTTQVASAIAAIYSSSAGPLDALSFLQAGASAVSRTAQTKLREVEVSAADFAGFDPTGATDSTAAVTAALASLGVFGGRVTIPRGAKVLIDTDLTIPANCHLLGPHEIVGTPGTNTSAPYGQMGGCLILNSAKTINLSPGSSIKGLLVYRKGMTFPAADSSAFAGTAITVNYADDAAVLSCMVLGFTKAVLITNSQRTRINYLWYDCIGGIEVSNAPDIPYFTNIHGWPFATIATYNGTNPAVLRRSGIGISLHDVVDWPRLENCFTFGYFRGLLLNNINNGKFVNVGADGGYASTVAIELLGTATDNTFLNCQSSGQDSGIHINTVAGAVNKFVACDIWASTSRGVLVTSGDVQFLGGQNRDAPYGFTIANANSSIEVDHVHFLSISSNPFQFLIANTHVRIGDGNDYGNFASGSSVVSGTFVPVQIAAVDPLPLPPNAHEVTITAGAATIGTIQGGWNGREVTLIFTGAVQINTSTATTNSVRLTGSVVFNAVAGSLLKIRHDGTQWREAGRCA